MKFLPLLWAGIWRKPSRTILMGLQIASAFLLFGLLQGLDSGVKQGISRLHADRLYVASAVSLGVPLPISMLPQLQRVRGVVGVSPLLQLPSIYQKDTQSLPITAVDVQQFFVIFPDYHAPPAAVEALKTHRNGAILGGEIARRYGIHVGDHIVLQSRTPKRDGGSAWELDVLGLFEVPGSANGEGTALVGFDFVNEGLLANRDTALLYMARVADPAQGTAVGAAIDRMFANSANETRTQSEGDMVSSMIQRLADIDFIVGAIISAVFFALLFATGSLLMQAVRERVPELAVLKTLGFSDLSVMTLILLEAVVVCVLAALAGLGLASLLLTFARSYIGITSMPVSVLVLGVAFALGLALLGGSPPAWRGLKLPVAAALADR